MSIKQYDQVDHPYHLPDQIDVFHWSMPFVADKIITLMKHILKKGADVDIDVDDDAHLKALADDGD